MTNGGLRGLRDKGWGQIRREHVREAGERGTVRCIGKKGR